jgi:hypothetical protein
MENEPETEGLKHRPMFLLPYRAFDGPYAGTTDCVFLSLGWAQYDPRSASVKALRHTGERWSRQSEELPLHRSVDAVLFLAWAINSMAGNHLNTIRFPEGTFDNQPEELWIQAGIDSPDNFAQEITTDAVVTRLARLRAVLNSLHQRGLIG